MSGAPPGYQKKRTRKETLRGWFRGMKALLDNGCTLGEARVLAVKDDVRRFSQEHRERLRKAKAKLAAAREASADEPLTTKKKAKKPGRPRVHRKKKGETDEQYRRRLNRKRVQEHRARKKGTKQ